MSANTLPATRTENGALATQETPKKNTLQGLLESQRDKLAMVLPKHLTPDKLIKVALVAVSKTPMLQQCTPMTVLQSVMTAAQLGLECGGVLGHAYLVPFKRNLKMPNGEWKNEVHCQLIIGYRGLIDLARRSGQIARIEARVVYQNDDFDVSYGLEGVALRHKPVLDRQPGELRLVYAIAQLSDGATQFELMTRAQIEGIRSRSKAKDNGPWVTDFDEMARKTVVKRLCKYLPLSVDIAESVEGDTRTEFGEAIDFAKAAQIPSSSDLNKRLSAPESAQLPSPETEVIDVSAGESVDVSTGEVTNSIEESAESHQSPAETNTQSAPSFDLGDWDAFESTCAAAAQEHKVDPEAFESAFKRQFALFKIKSGRRTEWEPDRLKVLTAWKQNKVDLATGRINE